MKSNIENIIKNVESLPALPMVASKLIQIVDDQHSVADDLAEVISKDQVLTAKILKLVNSAFFGLSSKVTTVSRAVVVLGYNSVKSLALGISVFKTAKSIANGKVDFSRERFWEHALGVAAGARLLAKILKYGNIEEAFVAGLLHDIGKLVFDRYTHQEFINAIELSKKEMIPLFIAEKETIGTDHEVAGDYLAERWGLPYPLKKAISQHHNPPVHDSNVDQHILKLVAIVNLSNTLCKLKGVGFSGNSFLSSKDEATLSWLNLDNGIIQRVYDEFNFEILKAKEFFGIAEISEGEHIAVDKITGPKAVIIEGEKKPANMAKLLLDSLNFDVSLTSKKEDYVELIKEILPDFILLDSFSPEEAEETKSLLKKELGKTITLIAVPSPFESGLLLKELKDKNLLPEKGIEIIKPEKVAKKVLIVDDEVNLSDIVKIILEKEGYQVLVTNNPEETLNKVIEFEPNLIILDLVMPNMDGKTVLKLLFSYLNAHLKKKKPEMIILSAFLDKKNREDLLAVGIKHFIEKPFDKDNFLKKIKELIG